TGDVFGSSLVAALTMGKSLTEAVTIAVNYTVACIRRTKEAGTEARYGVNFEQEIPLFLELLK
ncbi:MAG: bifunctional hydroxymethylpyrimidine kinase/phosphomethylpyrimidine kinase, partial [Firmicutes bacterium]|nr:bifunctional hydroxymethylpyrimidine kinase/phosphomethylpyrimidine kinase [Bacillota bacterium]